MLITADGWFLFPLLLLRQIGLVMKEIALWATQPSTCKLFQRSTPVSLNQGSSLLIRLLGILLRSPYLE